MLCGLPGGRRVQSGIQSTRVAARYPLWFLSLPLTSSVSTGKSHRTFKGISGNRAYHLIEIWEQLNA